MHGLTDAEARVVWSALALPGAAERVRLEGSGLASSTYHAARRRAYDEGWVRDRYVPDPVAFGATAVTFVIGRPYAEEIQAVARRWSVTESAAVVWTGTPLAFGTFFHPNAAIARRATDRLLRALPMRDASVLTVDLTQARVPVYFDFEGGWARLAGVPISAGYPFGIGHGAIFGDEGASARRPVPDRWRASALELLQAPFDDAPGISRWLASGGVDRRQRGLLEDGYLRPRAFLDPAAIPEYRGRYIDQFLLVTGESRERTDPTMLLDELRTVHHASPFLFASEGRRVLLGLLGHSGPRAPSAPSSDSPAAPVGALLKETFSRWLCRVDLFREEAPTLRTVVDHRYTGIVRAVSPAAAAPTIRARVVEPE